MGISRRKVVPKQLPVVASLPPDPKLSLLDQVIERCHKHHISTISIEGIHLSFETNAHDRKDDAAVGAGFMKPDPKPKPTPDSVIFAVSG